MSHLTFTLLMAILISGAEALLGNRSARERIYLAAYVFLACMMSTLAGGWFMRLVHG
ncbi:MAG: hypothetical protein LAQ69_30765 [Acidobacteriia bacterium]|nr:hypothetical protein [Terriglobia bacterium]